ncbi:tRNA dihydrouridine synthase DusB [soil metagenome]
MIRDLLAVSPIVLAPMEDVTDAAFRRVCRSLGAHVCVTEFVAAEHVIAAAELARRKATLAADDVPTAIQIYGADAGLLLAAARIAAAARPSFLDLNCGCWVPNVVGRGAGAAWLREPAAMVAMVRAITAAVDVPVTVKTRIGWGPESPMPIVELARRLEDAGIAALTIHCRTAARGHTGDADWTWARRARAAVTIPVIVNGDGRTAEDAVRALAETGCAGVMIGRAAIASPWIFREARALLAGHRLAPPSDAERRAVYRAIVEASVGARGEKAGVASAKRHSAMLPELRPRVLRARAMAEKLDVLA